MREPRNPFLLRTSEKIEKDTTFLRLFGSEVLDLLPKTYLWDQVQIIRSSPGAGKTSLFRLFTPSVLVQLYEYKDDEDCKELYRLVKNLDVFTDGGPNLLGIMISCAQNYAMLEDINANPIQKERLFYSLLNSRLTLIALRGILTLNKLSLPEDLERLQILAPSRDKVPVQVPIPGSGKELYEWAENMELTVCRAIDSFAPISNMDLEGHDAVNAFSWIHPDCITIDGKPTVDKTLVMFDDTHKLSPSQRRNVLNTVLDTRPMINIWISERLEALSPSEILSSGVTEGREYTGPVNLEDYWRSSHFNRFERAVENIANRRIKSAKDIRVSGPFTACLQSSIENGQWKNNFDEAIEKISNRISKRISFTRRYDDWINACKRKESSPQGKAIAWRLLEILIERDLHKAQLSFGFMLPEEDLDKKEVSSIRSAAEYLVSKDANVPYYFGMTRLAYLASSNIEQFLAFASEIYEECISAELLGHSIAISPRRQETIFKRVAKRRWDEIPRRMPNGREVHRFLKAIADFAIWETMKPRASYSPGVTGIAITMVERDRLIKSGSNSEYRKLLNVLVPCLAYNLLEASLDRSQGQKGKTWMLLYLNRWLCLHFGLPLHYGSWRPRTPDALCKWLDQGFNPPDVT